MRRPGLVILVFSLCSISIFSQTTAKDYAKLGLGQLQRKENAAAIASFTKCIQLERTNWTCFHNRALAYQRTGKTVAALADFGNSIRVNPVAYQSYISRADMYVKDLKDYDRALADYDSALRFTTTSYDAYNNRGVIFNKKGRYEEAISDFSRAIHLNTNKWNAYIGRATSYCKLGKTDLAAADEKRVLILGGKVTDPCLKADDRSDWKRNKLTSAVNLAESGKFEEAIFVLDEIIKVDPNYGKAYYERASNYIDLQKYDLAKKDIKKLFELNQLRDEAEDLELRLRMATAAQQADADGKVSGSLFTEQFADNRHGWVVGKNENSELKIELNAYSIETKSAGINTVWIPLEKAPKIDQTKNFQIRTKFTLFSGRNLNAVGLVWGLTDTRNMFELGIYPDGTWFYGKRLNGQNPAFGKPKPSPYLNKGFFEENELMISKFGKKLLIYLNGNLAETVPFESFNSNSTLGFVLYGSSKIEVDYLTVDQN